MKQTHVFYDGNRYAFDFGVCSVKNGFAQVDTSQDAPYFGTWCNPYTRTIISYVEGDVYKNVYETDVAFTAALYDMKRWNDDMGHRFLGIDPGFDGDLKTAFVNLGLSDLLH